MVSPCGSIEVWVRKLEPVSACEFMSEGEAGDFSDQLLCRGNSCTTESKIKNNELRSFCIKCTIGCLVESGDVGGGQAGVHSEGREGWKHWLKGDMHDN